MKRQPKEQKQATLKALLRRRVADVYTGAAGYEFDDGDNFATAELLSRVIPALEVLFGNEAQPWLFKATNLEHFDNIDKATDYLLSHEVRADK